MSQSSHSAPTYTHFHRNYAMTCNAHLDVIAFNGDPSADGYVVLSLAMQAAIARMIDLDPHAPSSIWRLSIDQGKHVIHWFFDCAPEIVAAREIAAKHGFKIVRDDRVNALPQGEILTSALDFEEITLESHLYS